MFDSFPKNVKAVPSEKLLTPDNTVFLFVDHQPQMFFGVQNADRQLVINAVEGMAKTAKIWDIPTVLTTVAAETFSGPIISQIQRVFPDKTPIDRTTVNAWEDERVVEAVKATGRKKIVLAGLWTEVCALLPTLSALDQGYEVYVVTDASGGVSTEVHEMAITRMRDAGAVMVTWMQVLLELQRDWARKETYDAVMEVLKAHGGAYGMGVFYVENFPAKAKE